MNYNHKLASTGAKWFVQEMKKCCMLLHPDKEVTNIIPAIARADNLLLVVLSNLNFLINNSSASIK